MESAHGIFVIILGKDLSSINAANEIYKEAQRQEITVDVLVNNAGFATHGLFSEISLEEEIGEIQVNVTSLTALTKLFLRDMVERGTGKVLNIASTAAFQPGPLMAVYYATKSFVLSFSEALSEELKGTGITVTALCPGPTRTGFSQRASIQNSILFKKSEDPKNVAKIGYKGLMSGKRVVIPGIINVISTNLVKFIPHKILLGEIKKLQY